MREHRAKSGKLVYYATRRELETLTGYRGNDRKGRACCPIHHGDNPTALAINWENGWATCWSCGDAWSIRIGDAPPQGPTLTATARPTPNPYQTRTEVPLSRPQTAPKGEGAGMLGANLATAIAAAVERLPGSPGEAYLAGRGIPLDVAQALGIGWAPTGPLAGRVIFPLRDPDGRLTSAIGRAANDHTRPKYKALPASDGYVKTLFNGGAIAQAKRSGHPVIVVEGPLDAAACVSAGLPLTVALCGKSYAHPAHFHGLQTVILALDADEAGQAGRQALWLDLTARGIEVLVLPAAALDGTKDLAEYWQCHRALPGQLMARVTGPHRQCPPGYLMDVGNPHGSAANDNPKSDTGAGVEHPWFGPTIAELHQCTAEAQRYEAMTLDDLPADVRAEAEALAVELGDDLDALSAFWADLHRREHMLTVEDRVAAHYALTVVIRQHDSSNTLY